MSIHGLRLAAFFACTFYLSAGCSAVPPVPGHANVRPSDTTQSDDDDDGWLWNKLTGRDTKPPEQDPFSPVVQASATEPVGASQSPSAASPIPSTAADDKAADDKADDDSGFDISDLSPDNIGNAIKKAAGHGPDEAVARSLMQQGESLFRQRDYSKSAAKFKSAAARWPDSTLEEDAMFLRGESLFFSDQYPKAQDVYDEALKKYDNSRHLDTICKRLFAIGQYWENLDQSEHHWPITPNVTNKTRPRFDTFGNAIKAYESVRMRDPIGPLADDSIMATANAYFRKGRFEDAAYHYDLLRDQYPRSEHQAQAHVLGVQSKLQVYQGHLYDGTPLGEADEIAEQAMRQFRQELGTEQQNLAQTRNEIVERKAERDMGMARYYDKKKCYAAARHYYRSIVEDYPRTQTAHQARARLDEIRNEPNEPSNRFKWLTDTFEPEDD